MCSRSRSTAARSAAAPSPGAATATTCWPPGCTLRSASSFASTSRRRLSSHRKSACSTGSSSRELPSLSATIQNRRSPAPIAWSDTWVSMGDKDGERRHNLLKRYQVNARLMAKAKPDALFMHCLPAHRGEEVTDEVIDGPHSVVFDEAENRLHAQKGILAWCFNEGT